MNPWSFFGGIASGVGNLIGGSLTNRNNRQLARKQNRWNLQQWNRENAYNHPAAQKARLEAAGLNADLMYGQGGVSNTAAHSPEMTAGASSADWSSLGNTVINNAMSMAQLNQLEAQTDKVKAETETINIDNKYKDIQNMLGIEISKAQIKEYGATLVEIENRSKFIQSQTANMDADTANKIIDGIMRSKQMEHLVREAAAKADIAESEARVAFETELKRVALVGYQSDEAQYKADYAKFASETAWVPLAIDAAQLGINIFDTALKFKNLKDFFKSRPDLFPRSETGYGSGN